MPLPRYIVGALASRVAARRRRDGRVVVTAVGKDFTAILSSSMRGPLVKRRAATMADAYAAARRLLDDAEHGGGWHRGEVVSVSVPQSDQ